MTRFLRSTGPTGWQPGETPGVREGTSVARLTVMRGLGVLAIWMAAACYQDVGYEGTSFRCDDDQGCPSGQACVAARCVAPGGSPVDARSDDDPIVDGAAQTPSPDAFVGCQPSFQTVAGAPGTSKYLVVKNRETWASAQQSCRSHSATSHLVVFDDLAELSAIRTFANQTVTTPWGLWAGYARDYDSPPLDSFVSVTDVPLPFGSNLWRTDEPNNKGTLGEVVADFSDTGNLNDIDIGTIAAPRTHYYVCECDGQVDDRTFTLAP
jgi:hypothetical protein